jgi:hypothetical protein
MTTHTQGQWRFSDNSKHWKVNPYSVTVRAPGVHSVTVANCPSRATIPLAQARANALLIASAPDMLKLLWAIKSHLYSGASLHAGAQLFDDDMPILSAIDHVLNQATKGGTA